MAALRRMRKMFEARLRVEKTSKEPSLSGLSTPNLAVRVTPRQGTSSGVCGTLALNRKQTLIECYHRFHNKKSNLVKVSGIRHMSVYVRRKRNLSMIIRRY
jgi:hypothetical protein